MSSAMPEQTLLGIGEVLQTLRAEFPDVTISKIRFLESEGLVRPARTASGYRKFSPVDVERLRYVLRMQRDHYLPLKVIRDHLDALDRGLEPPPLAGGEARAPRVLVSADGVRAEDFRPAPRSRVRLTRAELAATCGLDEAVLAQLESYGLLSPKVGGHFDDDALVIATTVAQMTAFGIEPRHLRAFRVAADREVGLVEQVVAPLARQRGSDARVRAEEAVRELAALSVRLHAALVKTGLSRTTGG